MADPRDRFRNIPSNPPPPLRLPESEGEEEAEEIRYLPKSRLQFLAQRDPTELRRIAYKWYQIEDADDMDPDDLVQKVFQTQSRRPPGGKLPTNAAVIAQIGDEIDQDGPLPEPEGSREVIRVRKPVARPTTKGADGTGQEDGNDKEGGTKTNGGRKAPAQFRPFQKQSMSIADRIAYEFDPFRMITQTATELKRFLSSPTGARKASRDEE